METDFLPTFPRRYIEIEFEKIKCEKISLK